MIQADSARQTVTQRRAKRRFTLLNSNRRRAAAVSKCHALSSDCVASPVIVNGCTNRNWLPYWPDDGSWNHARRELPPAP